ncbi:MAG: VWA domain-containing protein, partial [Rhodospirillaceae bacterium]|nr:VWA domain-containing protein [Rhodospirillaceae bacterium]
MAKDKRDISAKSGNAGVQDFLNKLAATPTAHAAGGRGRLLFAMDATASREPSWDAACQIQGDMFAQTATLGGLDVQLAYYRGYKDFRATPW